MGFGVGKCVVDVLGMKVGEEVGAITIYVYVDGADDEVEALFTFAMI